MTGTTATDTALDRRYGGDAPDGALPSNEVLDLLYRHRSVRRFTAEPVDDATVTAIVAAAQSAATSSNQQAWSVVEIRDPERRARAAELAGQQEFIRDAAVFLVFVADWSRAIGVAATRGAAAQAVDYVESTLVGFVDAALAAQNAVVAAESLGLGTVYVGSVRNAPLEVAELIGLPAGAFPVVGLAIGHPDPADAAGVKPRLPQRVVRHRETYRPADAADLARYDEAVRAYYATQGAARGWLDAVVARVRDIAGLHGRHTLRGALERRGLPSR
ncbi:NADPH-dependent oxidoreductase [Microbacterium sp. No. 7]|uniref:NADPH-dependent oxidoreductase n=1 Tax=Microbacterium sp. No. 7 TaxID=1714373 RepID=UPI0006D23583|nr:NADPH-dependent oxidoreductase [Microbacterium sp. No. 7]ALJ19141.1 nitroreductase [Microbacterium sp. No. 7]